MVGALAAAVSLSVVVSRPRRIQRRGPHSSKVPGCPRPSFEPFGGVYAREWAMKPTRRRPALPPWGWALALAATLSVAWASCGNWTEGLVALSLMSFVAQCYSPAWEEEGVLTADALETPAEVHRLVLSTFLHASWYHLGVNMWSLWYIGHRVERLFGPGRFLLTYLGSALVGNLLSALCKRRGRTEAMASVGASTAVFGLYAALAVFQYRHGLMYRDVWQYLLISIGVGALSPGVDNMGHVGGALGGAGIGYLWGPRFVFSLGGLLVSDRPIITWPFA